MDNSWVDKNLTSISVSDVTKPLTGRIARVDYWWLEKDGQVFKTKHSNAFQCNKDRRVIETVYAQMIRDDGFSVINIPVAYVEPRL